VREKDLSIRLSMLASMMEQSESMVDIGTDHAYLPIYLVQKKIVGKAVAADIVPGPLQIAKSHLEEVGLTDQICIRLSDGFNEIKPEEAKTAVVAGMGGFLICDILQRGFETGKLTETLQLIVAPQSDLPAVRERITRIGFVIRKEKVCMDRGKYYFAFDCRPALETVKETADCREPYLFTVRDEIYHEYLLHETEIKRKILEGNHSLEVLSQNTKERFLKLEKEIIEMDYMLKNW